MPSADLLSPAWYHFDCSSMAVMRSVNLYLQQLVQAYLERTGLGKNNSFHLYHVVLANDSIRDYLWSSTGQLSL